MEEELFPSHISLNDPKNLEEERRLFYVAITRAGESLSLSYANSRYKWGILSSCNPSRFLSEISDEFVERPVIISRGNSSPSERLSFDGPSGLKPGNSGFLNERKMVRVERQPETSPSEASDPSSIHNGTKVEHSRFGIGVVVLLEGDKATVDFKNHGKKQLLLKFAKLKIVI
jgi:DNA helicase-2/ATP-dependent DNA helicase PcrA